MVTTRNTTQRREVITTLGRVQGFLSAQELHALIVRGGGRISLATVYAQLKRLADAREVDTPELEQWSNEIAARFKYSDVRHVVELSGVCSSCRST